MNLNNCVANKTCKLLRKKPIVNWGVYIIIRFLIYSDVNECSQGACKNGASCTNSVGGYSCSCATGWEGTNCDVGKIINRFYDRACVLIKHDIFLIRYIKNVKYIIMYSLCVNIFLTRKYCTCAM